MAGEISHVHTATGDTLYATIRTPAGLMWNTAGTPNFEARTVANWGDYDVAMTETPASSYFYVGTFPAIAGNMVAGWYAVEVFKRAGGAPAISDVIQARFFGHWNGTTFKWWGNDAIAVGGTVQTAGDLLGVWTPAKAGYLTGAVALDSTVAKETTLATVAGYIDTEITSIINTLGAAGAGLSAIPWNVAWDAEVQSECTDALNAYDPPTNAEMIARTLLAASYSTLAAGAQMDLVNAPNATAVTAIQNGLATTTELNKVPKSDGTSSWNATALAALADAVWDEALAGHVAAGSAGLALSGASAPSAAAVADAVWDEAAAGHVGAGSTGAVLNSLVPGTPINISTEGENLSSQ